ncbi:MAG: flagellar basal body protein [Balneolia bacterium]|nr:flagellar basal body protein [Balneolia bacterium]
MAKALDTYTLRHRITAGNIANIDTPGYKRFGVEFEEELQRVHRTGGSEAMKEVNPRIVSEGEDVVLEDELIEMADTQIRMNLVVRGLRHHFEMLRTGITGINR